MKSDVQLQQDVIAELARHPSVDAARIGVAVNEGIVTLTGHVDSFAQKWCAERAAQRVCGIMALAVEIMVTLPGLSCRSDADIARAAEHALRWTAYLPMDSVKVMCENGWITVSGEVEWDYQRQAAANALRPLMGVIGVSAELAIRPRAA
jgi:osmotically-inducible protein OsmY